MANNERNRLEEDKNFADFELKRLIEDEGSEPYMYRDTKQIRTIGHGFNLDRPGAEEILKAALGGSVSVSDFTEKGARLSEEDAAKLLRYELPTHVGNARNFVGDEAWDNLDDQTRAAVVNMAFNLGRAGLRKFSGVQEGLQQAASGDPEGRKKAVLNMLYIDPNLPVEKREVNPYARQVKRRMQRLGDRVLGDLPAPEVREMVSREMELIDPRGRVAGMAGGGTVQTAKGLAALGRGPDNQLVHMAPKEVAALQRLATAAGGSLTINPETGLMEAGFLEDWLPTIVGLGLAPFTGGMSTFLAPAAAGLGATAITGDWKQGLKWGLGVSGGMGIGHAFGAGAGAGSTLTRPELAGVSESLVPRTAVDTVTQRLGPGSLPRFTVDPQLAGPNLANWGTELGTAQTNLKLGLADGFLSSAPPTVGRLPYAPPFQPRTVLDPSRTVPSLNRVFTPEAAPEQLGMFDPKRWSAERWKEGMGRFGDNITSGAGWKDAWHNRGLNKQVLKSVAGAGLGMYGRSLEGFEGPEDTSDEPAGYPEDAPYGYIHPLRTVTLPQRPAGDTSEMSYFDPSPYPHPVGYVPYDPTDERFYAAGGGLVNLPKYQEGGTVAATPDAGEASYLSSFTGATDAGLPALGGGVGGGEVAYFPRNREGMGFDMDITEYLESLDARGIPRMTGYPGGGGFEQHLTSSRAPTDLSALSGGQAWHHIPDPTIEDPATNPFPHGVFYRPGNQFMAGGVFTPTRSFPSYTPGESAPYDIQTETLGTITSEDKNPNTPWGSRGKTYGEYMSTKEQAARGRWAYDQYQDYMINMAALRGGTPVDGPRWRNIGPMEGGHTRIPGEVYEIPVPGRAPYGIGAGVLRGTPKVDFPRTPSQMYPLPSAKPGHAFMAPPGAVRRQFGSPSFEVGSGTEIPPTPEPVPARQFMTPGSENIPAAAPPVPDWARMFMDRPSVTVTQTSPAVPVPARQFMAAGGPVDGAGDGTSDSVPAKIDDRQPAALSTGEFVISADVVSGLGNGDTDAGAEQLYALMDRVRSKRSNGAKQPPTIRPRGLMPA
jgi:GH24 family phage-related lysozyme (muramidase)